jgi:hypothetical protein
MSAQFRQDFAVIANWIPFGAKVLDLGCEDGSLLKFKTRFKCDSNGLGSRALWL